GDTVGCRPSLADQRDGPRLVLHGRVDLSAADIPPVALKELRQRLLRPSKLSEHVKRGEHPRVGTPEVAEVEVTRMLPAEHRTGLSHDGLDEGVSNPSSDRG